MLQRVLVYIFQPHVNVDRKRKTIMNHLLLRTPKPFALESLRGYLLRLAEVNGLSGVAPILKLAGVSDDKSRHAEQPVEILELVTGHRMKDLAHLPLTNPLTNIQQVSGHPVSKGYSILSNPKICPCCIKENGYAPAYWDLIAVQGCYKHQQSLITECHECKAKLTWHRPGLLTCKCGADLSGLQGNPLSLEELEFLRVIDAKFKGEVLDDSQSQTGLPFAHLTKISLSTILALMHTMGSMHLFINKQVVRAKACTHQDEVKYALEILKDWPNNFYKFLHRVGEEHGRDSLGLDRQFSLFTQRFFKRGYPEQEIRFLKEAFIDFGKLHWGKAFYYPRMQAKSDTVSQSNFVGVQEFAEMVGHTPSAVRKMIADGRLVVKQLEGKKVGKVIIDLEKSNIQLPSVGNAMGVRDAGKFMGLPVSVITRLRKTGIYVPEHLTLRKGSFCKDDLLKFKQRIIACQQKKLPNDGLISIAYVMRKSFKSSSIKASIIEWILDGSLACFGSAKEIPDIKIRITDLEALTADVYATERDWISIKQTSAELYCDSGIVANMLQEGLIEGAVHKGAHQINRQSVLDFKQRYVTLQQLSSVFELGVKSLNYLCKQHGLALLSVRRKFNVSQNFIERSAVNTLANHVKEYYLNHKKLAYRCRLESLNLNWQS